MLTARIPSPLTSTRFSGRPLLAKARLERHPRQNITGVDISPVMLEVAKKKLQAYSQIKLYNASVSALPLDYRSFDLVICANAFHYFENPQLALSKMKRVVKPNGTTIILDWCRDYPMLQLWHYLFKFIDPAYRQCYTQRELEQLLADTGFDVVKVAKMRFGFIWELMVISSI